MIFFVNYFFWGKINVDKKIDDIETDDPWMDKLIYSTKDLDSEEMGNFC